MSCDCLQSGFCDFQLFGGGATIECPCRICLVKSMCKELICEIRDEHHLKIFGYINAHPPEEK